MRSRQEGMTFIGFALVAAMVAVMGFAALKLVPAYLENMKIKRVLADVQAELDGQGPTVQGIRRALDKRLNIEMVYGLKGQDFVIERTDAGYLVAARYVRPEPFIANVSLSVEFDDEVEIRQ